MLQFILTTILMASLGTMLYLVARSLPRIEEEVSGKRSFLDRIYSSEIPEKIDAIFNNFLFKFLRRAKIVILKVENFVNAKLKKISPNGNGSHMNGLTANPKPKIDFKELTETAETVEKTLEESKN